MLYIDSSSPRAWIGDNRVTLCGDAGFPVAILVVRFYKISRTFTAGGPTMSACKMMPITLPRGEWLETSRSDRIATVDGR